MVKFSIFSILNTASSNTMTLLSKAVIKMVQVLLFSQEAFRTLAVILKGSGSPFRALDW